ncbi:hypothetical protein [Streptosporangium carneum]|uniref:Uncharacterized protein n=1 Tax=Streptosporangium carneum TaxID=47481 RepID=A0A9W6I7A8_9ACTN|nr:hypothetical protein [Streptosporangium carneum]GLK12503.1 hypothetical protein GCM10017600_59130 [Streptosporangium carneum]
MLLRERGPRRSGTPTSRALRDEFAEGPGTVTYHYGSFAFEKGEPAGSDAFQVDEGDVGAEIRGTGGGADFTRMLGVDVRRRYPMDLRKPGAGSLASGRMIT